MTLLSKDKFIDYINFIKERDLAQRQINNIMSNEFGDNIFWPYNRYETMMINLLSEIFKDEGEWISYFVYELEFGSKYHDFDVYETDKATGLKKELPLHNASELYDLLIYNMGKKQ